MLGTKTEIEVALGSALDWQELPDRRASRIATYLRNADIADRTDWPRQHRWIIDELRRFRAVFTERVRALKLDSFGEPDGADAEAGV